MVKPHLSQHKNIDEALGVILGDVEGIQDFYNIHPDDDAMLRELHDVIAASIGDIIEGFYEKITHFPDTKTFFTDQKTLQRVKDAQHQNLLSIFRDPIDTDYVRHRTVIGISHERIGLPAQWYMGSILFFLEKFTKVVTDHCSQTGKDFRAYYNALQRRMFFDMSLVLFTYLLEREQQIKKQQKEILELSTPVLKISQGLLLVPLVGALTTERAFHLTEQLLAAIKKYVARVVVIDVTGIFELDTRSANHLLLTANSCRLMGNHVIFTGISSTMATTMVKLGIDFSSLDTKLDLQAGLKFAYEILEAKEPGEVA